MAPTIKEWVDKVTGDELGHIESYEIGEEIGGGGFSKVCRVVKRKHAFAMKLPDDADLHSDDTTGVYDREELFMDEARTWASISVSIPDDVVRLIDFNIEPYPWMVMELGDEDLEKGIANGDADIFTAVDLLRGLQRIHDLGYIHRDIKPKNIIRVRGKWKFSDFGLSKSVNALPSGSTKGTPEYMAPEQCSSKMFGPVDFSTDIWQMGILVFRMVTGRSPYPGATADTVGTVICVEGPDLDILPKQYRPILGKALARYRKDRYASATEFADALEGLAKKMMMCASCGNRQQYGMGYCLRCGEELGKAPEKRKIECHHCHRSFDITDEMTSCPFCGKHVFRTCPNCGAKQSWDVETCTSCGSELDQKALRIAALTSDLVMAIGKGDCKSSEDLIAELRSIDPKNPRITDFQKQLDDVRGFITKNRNEFQGLLGDRRYYAAFEVVPKLRRYPGAIEADHALRRDIADVESRVKAADLYCKKAAEADSGSARMAQYVAAAEICPDHPVARSALKEYPPVGPSDAVCSMKEQSLAIRIEPSSDSGVTYCIFRGEGRLPAVDDDTHLLAEIPTTVYMDKTMEPGVEYYYSIYSKRWGVLSKEGAHLGPAMTISEVDKVKIEPIDGGLRIMYEKPRGASRVRIWRADDANPAGTELPINDATVYDDKELIGGKKYHYLFVTEYEVRNRVERSEGVVFSATTNREDAHRPEWNTAPTFTPDLPEPVRDMVIKWSKADDTYFAKWGTHSRVSLYTSSEKPPYSGKRMSLEELRSTMAPIEPIDVFADGMKFSLPEGIHYVCPVIEHGDAAIFGTSLMIASLKPFRKMESYLSGGTCHLRMKWPDDATGALAMVSDGPCKPDDPDAPSVSVTREQYMNDGEMGIPVGKPDRTHISLYAIYRDARGQKYPSRGVEIDLSSQL